MMRKHLRPSLQRQKVSELSNAIRNGWLRQTFQARQSASPRKTVTMGMSAFIVWSPRSDYETFLPLCGDFHEQHRDPILAMRAIHDAIQEETLFGAVCRLLTEASTIRWIQEELLEELDLAKLRHYEAIAQKEFGDPKIGLACAILLGLPPHKAAACAVAVRGEKRFEESFPSLRSALEKIEYDKERKKWLALPKPESLSSEHSRLLPACQRLRERAAHLPFRKFVKEILERRLEKGALEIWDILKEGRIPNNLLESSVLSLLKKLLLVLVLPASDRETILQLLEERTNLGREEQQVGLAYLMVILLAPHIVAALAIVIKHRLAQYKTLPSIFADIERT